MRNKLLRYITYRVLNNLYFSLKKFPYLAPQIYSSKNNFKKIKSIEFNFADKNTHLGDRLFLFPLINFLLKIGMNVYFNDKDILSKEIYYEMYGTKIPSSYNIKGIDSVIISKPSYLSLNLENSNLIIVDFNDKTSTFRVPLQLIRSFQLIMDLDINAPIIGGSGEDGVYGNQYDKYIVFNNYIDSGAFRKFFCNEDLLSEKCRNLKLDGYKIIHVGSQADINKDRNKYDFVDIDLRGKISPSELVQIIKRKNIYGAVTYDNFIMHLMGFFSKKSYVLFRGRFKKSSKNYHFQYVNNSFYSDDALLEYL